MAFTAKDNRLLYWMNGQLLLLKIILVLKLKGTSELHDYRLM